MIFTGLFVFGVLLLVNGIIQKLVTQKNPTDPQVRAFIRGSDPGVNVMIVGGAGATVIGGVGMLLSLII